MSRRLDYRFSVDVDRDGQLEHRIEILSGANEEEARRKLDARMRDFGLTVVRVEMTGTR